MSDPSAKPTVTQAKLAEYDFEWVLPGHGRRHQDDVEAMRAGVLACVDWMRR